MMDQAGFQRTGREVALHHAARRSDGALAQGRRRGDASAAAPTPAATPCTIISSATSRRSISAGGVIYHCGPVVAKDGDGWRVTAAGPTTSIREEPYQGDIIRKYGVRAVMGKGGMGAEDAGRR